MWFSMLKYNSSRVIFFFNLHQIDIRMYFSVSLNPSPAVQVIRIRSIIHDITLFFKETENL